MHNPETSPPRGAAPVGEADTAGNGQDTAAASLQLEMRAAADSAVGHIRKVAATATTEAQLSAASAAAIASAAILGIALLAISWMCVLALGIWLAIEAGWPVWAALAAALGVNLAGVLICWLWYSRLAPNIGFARTRKLIFPGDAG